MISDRELKFLARAYRRLWQTLKADLQSDDEILAWLREHLKVVRLSLGEAEADETPGSAEEP